ncbi:MAG TPA: SH3 domain-containing protein [Anaerolineales bacterium]|nr:SH3 domain-containing protein [Anaerolineales bacterium]
MTKNHKKLIVTVVLLVGLVFGVNFMPGQTETALAQQPTGSIPTVTGTPAGPFITVTYAEQINVRSGPSSTLYPVPVGVMLPGETAPALGISIGGDWIQIKYLGVPGNIGWVYAPLVNLSPNANLIPVDAPPTPTPLTTATINPTLAAAFIIEATPTRLPTFTPAEPLVVATYEPATDSGFGLPLGLVIIIILIFGLFTGIIAIVRRSG